MNDQNASPDQIQSVLNQTASDNQFNYSAIPAHTHNGTDSLRISASDLISSPTVNGRSYLSSNQGITTTFITKITFDTNDYANGITWDSTNNRFTCLTPGKYLVNTSLQWSSPAANFSYYTRLYRSGSEVARGTMIPGNFAGFASQGISDIVTMVKDDYLEVFAFQSSGGSINVSGGTQVSFLSLAKL